LARILFPADLTWPLWLRVHFFHGQSGMRGATMLQASNLAAVLSKTCDRVIRFVL
jgi:hypothetical protein